MIENIIPMYEQAFPIRKSGYNSFTLWHSKLFQRFYLLCQPHSPWNPCSEPFLGFMKEFSMSFRVLRLALLWLSICQVTHVLYTSTFYFPVRVSLRCLLISLKIEFVFLVSVLVFFQDENGIETSILCHLKIRSLLELCFCLERFD